MTVYMPRKLFKSNVAFLRIIFFLCCVLLLCSGEQGWQSGESTHLPPMWLGLIPGLSVICGLSLWLVLVPAPRVFLHVLWFSSLHKSQHFQIPI